jgi:hypothetical protein
MATVEAPIPLHYQDANCPSGGDRHCLVLRWWKNTQRLYRNKWRLRPLIEIEKESPTGKFKEVAAKEVFEKETLSLV